MAFSGNNPNSPQMNVTPLIDVLLVLIIIFMVVVIEQRPTGLKAEIPQPAPVASNIPPPQRTIVIQVKHAKPSDQHPGVNIEVKINDEVRHVGSPAPALGRHLRHSGRAHRLHRSRRRHRLPRRSRRNRDCAHRRSRPRGIAHRRWQARASDRLARPKAWRAAGPTPVFVQSEIRAAPSSH